MLGYAVAALHMRPCDFYGLTLAEYYQITKIYAILQGSKDDSGDDVADFLAEHIALNGLES